MQRTLRSATTWRDAHPHPPLDTTSRLQRRVGAGWRGSCPCPGRIEARFAGKQAICRPKDPAKKDQGMRERGSSSNTPGARRRLLVLAFYYPPNPEIGGLRWAGLTKYLVPLGWDSWIVTACREPATDGRPAGVTVESCPPRPTLNSRYRAIRLRMTRNKVPTPPAADLTQTSRRGSLLMRAVGRLRTEVAGVMALTADGSGTVFRTAMRTRALIREVQPHAIISTGPPHATHLSAWLATRGQRTPWLVDLRDPFAGAAAGLARRTTLFHRSRIVRSTYPQLEKLVFNGATGILTTTPELGEDIVERYPGMPVSWIPNGIDAEFLPSRSEEPFPGLGIAYAGQIYGARNPSLVLRALRRFLDKERSESARASKIRVAGQIMATHSAALNRDISELGLEEHVDLLGPIPRSEALQLLARSRLALVLAQDQAAQIPAKLYESVTMGVSTVVIADRESASGREAEAIGAAVVEPDDVDGMLRVLEGVWRNRDNDRQPPPARIHYREIAHRLVPILEELAVEAEPR